MTQYTRWQDFQRSPSSARNSALEELRRKMHEYVIHELGPLLYDERVSETELRRQVHEQLHKALAREQVPLSASEKAQLIQNVSDDVLGYGPIDRFLKDPDINEVMVNGPRHIYVERRGRIEPTDVSFVDEMRRRLEPLRVDALPRPIDGTWTQADLFAALEKADHFPDDPNRFRPNATNEGTTAPPARRPIWSFTNGLRVFGWTTVYTVPWAVRLLREIED